nr:hypothetical protein [Microbacterium trichothecenolyticum]
MELTVAVPAAQGAISIAATEAMAAYVEEATEGKVTFEFFYSDSLLPNQEAPQGVASGIADVGFIGTPTLFAGDLPASVWMGDAASYGELTGVAGFVQDSLTYDEMMMNNDTIRGEVEAMGLTPIAAMSTGQWGYWCKQPVPDLAAAQGLSAVVPGEPYASELSALGFEPGHIPAIEVYEAMERGVVDCHSNPIYIYDIFSMYDVAPNIYVPQLSPGTMGLIPVIRTDLWESFSPELKEIFADSSRAALAGYIEAYLDAWKTITTKAADSGAAILQTAPEVDEILADVQEQRRDAMGGSAPASVENPEQFLTEYREVAQRWQDAMEEAGVVPQSGMSPVDEAAYFSDVDWQQLLEQLPAPK